MSNSAIHSFMCSRSLLKSVAALWLGVVVLGTNAFAQAGFDYTVQNGAITIVG